MELGLKGKVAFVTGGSKGIGKACVLALAQEGVRVAAVARGKQLLEDTARVIEKETGSPVLPLVADATRMEDVRRAVDHTIQKFGRVDILVNNAGAAPGGLLLEISDQAWLNAMNLKFMGYVRCCQAVIPHMLKQGGGRIINVVGNDGEKHPFTEICPSTCNAADVSLTNALAVQYARHNILVNAIHPGPVETDRQIELIRALAQDLEIPFERAKERITRSVPLGRMSRPEEVADLVVFLASERASYITGANILFDGAQQKALMELAPDSAAPRHAT